MEEGNQVLVNNVFFDNYGIKNKLLISIQLEAEGGGPQKKNFEHHLQIINDRIEEVLDELVDKLPLSAGLLREHIPYLIKQAPDQLKAQLIMTSLEEVSFCYFNLFPKDINNIFINEIAAQMRLLVKSYPIALLAWLVVLCKFSRLISHVSSINQYDSICNIWKSIAVSCIDETVDSDKIGYYLACFSSLLLRSAQETS